MKKSTYRKVTTETINESIIAANILNKRREENNILLSVGNERHIIFLKVKRPCYTWRTIVEMIVKESNKIEEEWLEFAIDKKAINKEVLLT